MPNYRSIMVISVLCFLFAFRCDKGIEPGEYAGQESKPYGIRGVLRFNNWAAQSAIYDLVVAACRDSQPRKAEMMMKYLQGRIEFSSSIGPYASDSIHYELLLSRIPPGNLPYIAVVQQTGESIDTNTIRVVGIYYDSDDTLNPGSVFIPPDSVIDNIDMTVDFIDLPPQPPSVK